MGSMQGIGDNWSTEDCVSKLGRIEIFEDEFLKGQWTKEFTATWFQALIESAKIDTELVDMYFDGIWQCLLDYDTTNTQWVAKTAVGITVEQLKAVINMGLQAAKTRIMTRMAEILNEQVKTRVSGNATRNGTQSRTSGLKLRAPEMKTYVSEQGDVATYNFAAQALQFGGQDVEGMKAFVSMGLDEASRSFMQKIQEATTPHEVIAFFLEQALKAEFQKLVNNVGSMMMEPKEMGEQFLNRLTLKQQVLNVIAQQPVIPEDVVYDCFRKMLPSQYSSLETLLIGQQETIDSARKVLKGWNEVREKNGGKQGALLNMDYDDEEGEAEEKATDNSSPGLTESIIVALKEVNRMDGANA